MIAFAFMLYGAIIFFTLLTLPITTLIFIIYQAWPITDEEGCKYFWKNFYPSFIWWCIGWGVIILPAVWFANH